jgi:phosphoenolpyruvate-protein kinase (PTS system EI component)
MGFDLSGSKLGSRAVDIKKDPNLVIIVKWIVSDQMSSILRRQGFATFLMMQPLIWKMEDLAEHQD